MKQLVKDGVWQVPAAGRPKGWESLGVAEPATSEKVSEVQATALLDTIVAEAEVEPIPSGRHVDPRPDTWAKRRSDFDECAEAIDKDAVEFGAEWKQVICAKVMMAGMWTRSFWRILKWVQCPSQAKLVASAMKRFEDCGIWSASGETLTVRLGEMDGSMEGLIEFWLNAGVGAGIFDAELRNEKMYFRSAEGSGRTAA